MKNIILPHNNSHLHLHSTPLPPPHSTPPLASLLPTTQLYYSVLLQNIHSNHKYARKQYTQLYKPLNINYFRKIFIYAKYTYPTPPCLRFTAKSYGGSSTIKCFVFCSKIKRSKVLCLKLKLKLECN